MTNEELTSLKEWRNSPSCPHTACVCNIRTELLYRTYLHEETPMRFWEDPSKFWEDIKAHYNGGQRLIIDLERGIFVTKVMTWEDLFPGDPKNLKLNNAAPPIDSSKPIVEEYWSHRIKDLGFVGNIR